VSKRNDGQPWWHRAPTSLVLAIHEGKRKKFVAALRAPTCGFLHYLLSEQSTCTCHIVLSLFACSRASHARMWKKKGH
jgi:hypothetical protein